MDFLLDACEGLVANATSIPDDDALISLADTKRWQSLFAFTASEAEKEIRDWRSNLGRERLTHFAWEAVKSSAKGFDKESYEYALGNQRLPCTQPMTSAAENRQSGSKEAKGDRIAVVATLKNVRFLLKLEGEIPTIAAAQAIGKLDHPPLKYEGENEDGVRIEFCIVNTDAKKKILQGLTNVKSAAQPLFIRLPEAEKDLSAVCRFPTLGIDTTMPQHRVGNKERPAPGQDEYPVWYFFYGTLADKDILGRLLQRPDGIGQAALRPAYVLGGKLATLGKYRALVHGHGLKEEPVAGSAFLVQTREEEDALRHYETELYAVVRCVIHISSGSSRSGDAGKEEKVLEVNGLTFLGAA
ncbi:hypothetical protein E0Z10_g4772 [Xylaria hypoxylon]|uniref:Putative gamma-glutamylcyclotransferase n=1 Tax=Xylaria hypoxylon TaxID=37992 RepID=A0A4Z0YZK4_9PEZI|nr:hypothetical protein E0Z10_g4772 [Xylaria hypoxylon]